ncbi:hypothetical protein BT63DRAFT_474975 [Microthyrium microscopicum]|uniref:Concanavalin A-like lectin/glucanase n=1 Tax=Microthyrium microscopicum TaxID=703497 RepID=A0A6A6UVA7_9PEZI|nr:hypothetical protein BT63DRAFT_474975 [Microthyrium microscopicum]
MIPCMLTLLLAIPWVSAQLGVSFSSGYDFFTGKTEIIRTETTFTPGAMELKPKGNLFLWPGLWVPANRTTGDLIQTVISADSTLALECGAKKGQWCIAPYVMHGVAYADRERRQLAIDPDAKIRIIYSKTTDGAKWVQTTLDATTGKMLQNYTGGTGKKVQFEFSTELQYGNLGTTSTQVYEDTVITLAAPDMAFGKGKRKGSATIEGVTSEQEGKIWKIKKVVIPAMRSGVANHPATGKEIHG